MPTLSLEHILRRAFQGHKHVRVSGTRLGAIASEKRYKWGLFPYWMDIARLDADNHVVMITVYHDDEALGVFLESKIRSMINLDGKKMTLYFA